MRYTRISLRQVITSVAVFSALFALGKLYGLPGALLATVILLTLVVAVRVKHLVNRILLFSFAATCIWFLCVHSVYVIQRCPHCYFARSELRHPEILGIPLSVDTQVSLTVLSLVAEDFGCPCSHEGMEIVMYSDDWGMLVRYPESFTVGFSPGGDFRARYVQFMRPTALRFAREHPDLAMEFCQRIRGEWDNNYLAHFLYEQLKIPDLPQE